MAVELITGLGDGPHVDAGDVGGFQAGIVGTEDYVLSIGKKMESSVITNNKVRINDGEGVMQGRHWRIKPGTYEDVTIDNGAQGMNRKDAIVARYTKESSSGIEKVELVVLKGTPTASTPTEPVPTKGDIRGGTLKHEMLLYVVSLKGLNIESVTAEFDILMNMSKINKSLSETFFELIKTSNGCVKKYQNGMFESWQKASIPNTSLAFTQIGSTNLHYARYTNFNLGITATKIYNIQTSAMNNGLVWAARPSLNADKGGIDGYIIQLGADKAKTTYLDAYVVGKWK